MLLDHRTAPGAAERLVPSPRESAEQLSPPPRAARSGWIYRYRAVLVGLDVLAATLSGLAILLGPGAHLFGAPTWWSVGGLVALWPLVLVVLDGYSDRILGAGSEEYRRVLQGGLLLLAAAGFASYAARLDLPRSLVVIGIPLLTLLTLVLRWGSRRVLGRLRSRGRCTKRVIVVGRSGAVLELKARLERAKYIGLDVVGVCVTPDHRRQLSQRMTIPVGGLDDVAEMVGRCQADTVAVTSASETAADYLRRLSWQLEGSGIELLVAPGLVEVAGPRLHIRPFDGLPLLTVEEPEFHGWRRLVKGGLDRLVAGGVLVLLAPVLAAVALAVRLTGPGPVLFRQERVGMHGRSFTMLKFRSMVVDAEQRLEQLREANASDGLLFKMREDPRVTPVGRWLRRLSLDELPQLFNVLGGSMSLVGPRPPLPGEVARYDSSVRRRLLVKPGLTGLWQISGRSDLPWEEAVRLDLWYVENWSLALDAQIVWKTGRAVLTSSGAY